MGRFQGLFYPCQNRGVSRYVLIINSPKSEVFRDVLIKGSKTEVFRDVVQKAAETQVFRDVPCKGRIARSVKQSLIYMDMTQVICI